MKTTIALVGNPNCGKTTLFNELTGSNQYTGNWPGVTVERKSGVYRTNKEIEIVDLPGVYSLSPYSPEEIVTRDYLQSGQSQVVINIVDATNLERNLYLTTQILQLGEPVVVALNMIDLVRKNGDEINVALLSSMLGCPVIEISALRNMGIDHLIEQAIAVSAESGESSTGVQERSSLLATVEKKAAAELAAGEEEEDALAAARYDAIAEVCAACVKTTRRGQTLTQKIDRIVTNRILGIPIFIVVMFFVYFLSISTIGTMGTDWVNDEMFPAISEWMAGLLEGAGCEGWVQSLLIDGIIGGVGAVLGFVPQMIVLFLCLSLLEGCGYMARVAFVMDRVFRRFGLSGKSFIPILIATGCGVTGVLATKTIENESDRRMTIMTTTMIPCGAKLPIIALVFGALAGGFYEDTWWVAPLFYFLGLLAIIVSCVMLKKLKAFAGNTAPFIMELPQYHLPHAKNVIRATWERVRAYLVKAGTIIFLSSIVIWFLLNFGFADGSFGMLDVETEGYMAQSLMAVIGKAVGWIFAPLGFGTWEAAVTTFTGLVAKENVVATVGVITSLGEGGEGDGALWHAFAAMMGDSSAAIAAFCAFNLLCAPCFAAIGAIRSQMKSAQWTWATIGYMCVFAWCVALMVYQGVGLALGELGFSAWTVVAALIAAAMVVQMVRPATQPKCLEE